MEDLVKPPNRFQAFIQSHRGRVILLAVLFTVVFVGAIWAAYARYMGNNSSSQTPNSFLPGFSLNNGAATKAALLTGLAVEVEKSNRRPLAVMIENHPDARPQVGLIHADTVFEAIVEGGITRFMAIYSSEDADKIGPIRSSRPFYVHWAAGFHALYAHAGGSEAALALIPTVKEIVDLPHTAAYFERDPKPGIASEHTLFSSTKDLYAFATEKKVTTDADISAPKHIDNMSLDKRPPSAQITIDFSAPSYKVEWTYERESNKYKRSLAGSAHVDRVSGDQITTSNVAVIDMPHTYNPNTNQGKGEWSMPTEGTGKLKLFQNGALIEGTWKKTGIGDMMLLLNSNGKPLELVKGTTWFEIVPPDVSVTHEEKAATTTSSSSQ